MSLTYENRLSDSPYVESITAGWTTANGSSLRPAETNCHMVFVKHPGGVRALVVGPLTAAGMAVWGEGAEILWIKFKLGTFIPHMPTRTLLDTEIPLPEAASPQSFWLKGSAWQFPNYENADTFIDRLARDELLVRDPVVTTALQGHPQEVASRTIRHRFLRATGLTQSHIYQFERAQRAAALLQRGIPILDTVHELGYFDQPHLTRALKRFIGKTPGQQIAVNGLTG